MEIGWRPRNRDQPDRPLGVCVRRRLTLHGDNGPRPDAFLPRPTLIPLQPIRQKTGLVEEGNVTSRARAAMSALFFESALEALWAIHLFYSGLLGIGRVWLGKFPKQHSGIASYSFLPVNP